MRRYRPKHLFSKLHSQETHFLHDESTIRKVTLIHFGVRQIDEQIKPCGKMVVPHLDQREINAGSSAGSELFQPVKPLTTGLLFHGTL